jgi:hypothetical protein
MPIYIHICIHTYSQACIKYVHIHIPTQCRVTMYIPTYIPIHKFIRICISDDTSHSLEENVFS